MANQMHLPFGVKLPIKETFDYAKNAVFLIGLQAIAMTLTSPHKGVPASWWWYVFASFIVLPTAALSAMNAQLYHENWPDISPIKRWLLIASSMLVVFFAGIATKIRILEGW